jgi:N-acetylated-alpha-linked acidic dipeptidase
VAVLVAVALAIQGGGDPDAGLRRVLDDYIRLYARDTLPQWRELFLPGFVASSTNDDGSVTTRTLDEFYQRQQNYFATGRPIRETLDHVRAERAGRLATMRAEFVLHDGDTERRGRLMMLLIDERGDFKIASLTFTYHVKEPEGSDYLHVDEPKGSYYRDRPLGFSGSAAADERAAERAFADGISTERLSATHRALTERPHPAGTKNGSRVAQWIADTLAAEGLKVETAEYSVYLSRPRRVQVRMRIGDGRPVSLRVTEPASAFDPDTAHPDLDPGYVAYSASGHVAAPIVYVDYGLPPDYAALASKGVEVRGRIAVARYGRSHRAVKVHLAQQSGAAAVILYSDPADDGEQRGPVWPDGPWRPSTLLQRGNAKFSWFWHGDPLTPGVAATPSAAFLDPARAPTLPRIPVVVLSAGEAARLLSAPTAVAELDVEMDNRRAPIRNVIARLDGGAEPDREVLLGTHHDAWTFGGVDPGTGSAVLIEVARGAAALAKAGWRPRRSLVFAFWDAEEYGLIGSTEFAEDHPRLLRERVVCYLNSDYSMGDRLDAGGTPSLRDFIRGLASDLGLEPPAELAALGSGADFVAFQDFLGLPTLSLELDFDGSYGTYHSSHDTRRYVERVGDPGFRRGARLARLIGTAAIRLASADVLPFRYSHYARRIADFAEELKLDDRQASDASLRLAARAASLEARIDELLAGRVSLVRLRPLNDALARLEQTLLDESERPDRRWYRHVIYGWNIYSLYDGQPLPGLSDAIRRKDREAIERERERLMGALARFDEGLARAEQALSAH